MTIKAKQRDLFGLRTRIREVAVGETFGDRRMGTVFETFFEVASPDEIRCAFLIPDFDSFPIARQTLVREEINEFFGESDIPGRTPRSGTKLSWELTPEPTLSPQARK